MKKILSVLLTAAMVISLCCVTVSAKTSYYDLTGAISVDPITGQMSGAFTLPEGSLGLSGSMAITSDSIKTFTGTLSDTFGTVNGKINTNGNSLFAEIIGIDFESGYYFYLYGWFALDGDYGPFVGKLVKTASQIAGIAGDITVTSTEGVLEAPVGGTLHMQVSDPVGYEVLWGIDTGDRGFASIDADGTLHILSMPTDGEITVLANTMDPNVRSQNVTIAVTDSTAYTVMITPNVNFGKIDKSMGIQSRDFTVSISDAVLESGAVITVTNSTTDMSMKDRNGAGSNTLPFALTQTGGIFTFAAADLTNGAGTISSTVTCNPVNLQAAGSYKGYMTFTIDHAAAG